MRNNQLVLQGLAFVTVVVLLVGLAIAQYAGAFRSSVPVLLKADHAGSQLNQRADVKVRGMIVGRVDSITSTGDGADIMLGIDPDKIDQIPQNVTARLLPKTLFGEKFVALDPPATAERGRPRRRRRHRAGPQLHRPRGRHRAGRPGAAAHRRAAGQAQVHARCRSRWACRAVASSSGRPSSA